MLGHPSVRMKRDDTLRRSFTASGATGVLTGMVSTETAVDVAMDAADELGSPFSTSWDVESPAGNVLFRFPKADDSLLIKPGDFGGFGGGGAVRGLGLVFTVVDGPADFKLSGSLRTFIPSLRPSQRLVPPLGYNPPIALRAALLPNSSMNVSFVMTF